AATPAITPSGPSATPDSTPGAPAASPSAAPSPSAATRSGDLVPGTLAVTVSDSVRVRSAPRVADDSVKFTPVLPVGTSLVVTAGPVKASDYTWYRVAPIGLALDDGVDQGWVAIADHDGTPWVALASDPTPGFELASVTTDPVAATTSAARRQAAAVNAFGLALYKRLRVDADLKGAGIVFSPYSIVTALAMARAGAKGETARQMDEVLRAGGWADLATGVPSLATLLARRDGAWTVRNDESGKDDVHYQALRIANMAFGQRDFHLEQAYLKRVSQTFRSGFGLVDYIADPNGARDAINGWVSQQTLGRIPELLGPPDVTSITRLVLVNAVYFKAEWAQPFIDGETTPRRFTRLDGSTVRVPTMKAWGEQEIPIAKGDGWRGTELRYLGPDGKTPLAMTIIQPTDLRAFEKSLTTTRLGRMMKTIAAERRRLQVVSDPPEAEACPTYPYSTTLYMPKFGIDTKAKLAPMLKAMGMTDAFDLQAADFSGMTTQDRLYIGFVIHQANIDVDERGTEAAAATAVGMDTGGCTGAVPLVEKTLRLDHPFLFLVRDLQTGAILFMGRVLDPSKR
ncbi:MAG TPA: serpin family protein, partial [Candidatus Limnocylindrales bacterium]|nr:serpin family protein [Candidatus Limnocylindrales bacterium]